IALYHLHSYLVPDFQLRHFPIDVVTIVHSSGVKENLPLWTADPSELNAPRIVRREAHRANLLAIDENHKCLHARFHRLLAMKHGEPSRRTGQFCGVGGLGSRCDCRPVMAPTPQKRFARCVDYHRFVFQPTTLHLFLLRPSPIPPTNPPLPYPATLPT